MTSTATSRPAPPPIPSHSSFLRAQIRSSLAHLRATSDVDEASFQQMDSLLTNGNAAQPLGQMTNKKSEDVSEQEKTVGANNAWLRKALLETSLLSDTVSLALSLAVPSGLLGSAQRQSIIQLVEVSKVKIANAITDPSVQRKTTKGAWIGAKGVHTGIRKGFNAAGQNLSELSQKREETRIKADIKKSEKQEKKAIKDELKKEREDILIKRQMNMLGGNEGASERKVTAGGDDSGLIRNVEVAIPATRLSQGHSSSTKKEVEADSKATDIDGDAMVSVSCSQLPSFKGGVAATTTFSPWPGLLLTSTLVATTDEDIASHSGIDDDSNNNLPLDSVGQPSAILPPPRRAPPQSSQSSNAG